METMELFSVNFIFEMRRVWFVHKIFESILGLCALGYHARGFLNIKTIQQSYTYVTIFGCFSLFSMFGCLSICLKEPNSHFREGVINLISAVVYIFVSIDAMYHAETDFHLMYLSLDENMQKELEELEEMQEPHPFFKYSKAQSVCALCNGCLFLLHSILAFDMALVDTNTDIYDGESVDDVESLDDYGTERLPYYVFGKKVHDWLSRYEWFSQLADDPPEAKPL